jgi:hypothetical protein
VKLELDQLERPQGVKKTLGIRDASEGGDWFSVEQVVSSVPFIASRKF